jgi:hypothetical protein
VDVGEGVELIRQHLFRNQRVVSKEVTAAGILTILQELWYKTDLENLFVAVATSLFEPPTPPSEARGSILIPPGPYGVAGGMPTRVHHASCIMHHASCIMHHESCVMRHASCTMHPHSSLHPAIFRSSPWGRLITATMMKG